MYSSFYQTIARVLPLLISITALSGCTLKTASGTKVQNATAATTQPSPSKPSATQTSASTSANAQTDVQSGTTQPDSGIWKVTDPVEGTLSQAQTDYEAASQAMQNGQYAQAIKLAAQSYHAMPSDEARSMAMYAASQLSPIELTHLESSITLPLEAAVIGQLRLNICASQHDNACVAAILPATATALDAIGDAISAQRLRDMFTDASHSVQPVVAVLLPLSGTDRRIGRAMLGAILQAAGIYTKTPLPFALRFFDTRSDAQSIPNILADVQKLGAKLILGPLDIKESMAVIPKLAETQTVMLGFSPNGEFTKQTPAAFQFSYALTLEADLLAQTMVALTARKIIAVSPEDAYAATSIQQLQTSLPLGMTVSSVTFPANQTDLRDIAKKIAAQTPDIVYLPTTPDTAERIASFMAQENLWCKTPDTPAPTSKIDTRKFTTCLGPSTWAPIDDNHRYKSLTEAIYLDYTESATTYATDFATQFHAMYHRHPAVHEILPFVAISMLKTMPDEAWQTPETLQTSVQTLLRGQNYLMIPSLRQITATGSQPFGMISTAAPTPERTLSTVMQ